jgi:hypothetical protein
MLRCCILLIIGTDNSLIANRVYEHVFSIHREIEADDGSRKT